MEKTLYVDLLFALGITFNDNGILVDAENEIPILFNGKRIVSRDDCRIRHFNDIEFIPLYNNKLCEFLLTTLTPIKLEEDYNIHMRILSQETKFSKEVNGKKIYKFSQLATTTQNEYQSEFYYNINLAMIDLIFKLNQYPIGYDLSRMDRTI